MKVFKTELDGLLLIEPQVFRDRRGYFFESYSYQRYRDCGIDCVFVQDNQSLSAEKGVIRGLHFQRAPHAQSKLVRCTMGTVMDVIVDLRKKSPTFKKWVSVELSADNHRQLFIPAGCAQGFATLTENCLLQYKVDDYYSAECDGGIAYNDPEFSIDWGIAHPILSEMDKNALPYSAQDIDF